MTSQIKNKVLCDSTGSMVAESGSGMSSMSLSSIDWKPRMLDPSNPRPPVKLASSSSPRGRLKCCHVPGRSMNLTSTTSTPSALARSITSRGLVFLPAFVSIAMNTLLNLPEPWKFDGPRRHRRNRRAGAITWGSDESVALLYVCTARQEIFAAPLCRAFCTSRAPTLCREDTFRAVHGHRQASVGVRQVAALRLLDKTSTKFTEGRSSAYVSRRTSSCTRLAQLGRYGLAAHRGHAGRNPERSGPGDPVRRADEAQMVAQLRPHGPLRIRDDTIGLDALELQHELR